MPLPEPAWVKLQVGTTSSGQPCWVACLRVTARHYGWDVAFPLQAPPVRALSDGSRRVVYCKQDGRGAWGGKSLRICRSAETGGHPAGVTNRFRVSRNWRVRDSVALAEATTADWAWMEALDGRRRTRAQWLSMAVSLAVA